MKHFGMYLWLNEEPKRVEFTQYKSRQMYLSNVFTFNNHKIKVVRSYNTYIGFIVDNTILITWGYRQYSCTTSKQITQLCNEEQLHIKKVDNYGSDIEMLNYYLEFLV